MHYVDKRSIELFRSFQARVVTRATIHAARRGRSLGGDQTRCASVLHMQHFHQAMLDGQQRQAEHYAARVASMASKAKLRFVKAPKRTKPARGAA